jgi:predicted nucleic acid-binding protein
VNVFVDTSALYAVIDAADEHHEAARAEWIELLRGEHSLCTTSYVLVETVALVQARIGIDAMRVLTSDILPVLDVSWVDEGTHRSAHSALLIAGRRELSLVDCVSFETMRRLHLNIAFCFDARIAEQGLQVLPEPG